MERTPARTCTLEVISPSRRMLSSQTLRSGLWRDCHCPPTPLPAPQARQLYTKSTHRGSSGPSPAYCAPPTPRFHALIHRPFVQPPQAHTNHLQSPTPYRVHPKDSGLPDSRSHSKEPLHGRGLAE